MRVLILTIACSWLAGCAMTELVWTKDDATATLVSSDLTECRRLANDEMWRMGWERVWPPPFYDPRFMPRYYRGMRPFWFDPPASLNLERALVEFCMHSKGYRLESPPR